MKTSNDVVREWIEARGMKMGFFAKEHIGVDKATLSCWINGLRLPSLEKRQKLKDITKARIDGWKLKGE